MSVKETPTVEQLNADRRAGLTRTQIAAKYGLGIPEVKRLLSQDGVSARASKRELDGTENRPRQRIREKPRYSNMDESISLMDRAKEVLGTRMGENHIGYTLDGIPANSWQVLKAAGLSVRL